MFFVFILGPALLVIWAVAPFVAKPLVFRTLLGTSSFLATVHSWLAHGISLTVKLAGLQVTNEICGLAVGSEPLVGEFPLLHPFTAGYLLGLGAILASTVEYLYIRLALGMRKPHGFRVLAATNILIDCIIAIPTLIFWLQVVFGNVHHI